jgi:hypothetical protein
MKAEYARYHDCQDMQEGAYAKKKKKSVAGQFSSTGLKRIAGLKH